LPTPERKGRQFIGEQTHLTGSLHHVVRGCKQSRTAEGKNHGIGMNRAQTPVTKPRCIEVQIGPDQLRRNQNAYRHAHNPPHNGHDSKLPDHPIVKGFWLLNPRAGIAHKNPLKQKTHD
jgi:hypothetical protein